MGRPDNVLLLRKGAGAEINSGIERAKAAMVESLDGIATNGEGRRLVSKEPVVLINLPKRSNGKPSNVTVRGTSALGLELRPQVRVIEGRMFRPGTSEIIAGRSVAGGFRGAALGETLRFAQRDWVVVGVFDSDKTAFDSEIWGDAEQMLAAFRRPVYSTLVLRLNQREALAGLKAAIGILGLSLSVIFSIGAIVGAMITMFAAVAQRVGEIGTLRALGFRRGAVLVAFLAESLLLSLVGGVVGLAAASGMQAVDISTTNFQTFSEIAFQFRLTPAIAAQTLLFALAMGFVGGFIPAWRAA